MNDLYLYVQLTTLCLMTGHLSHTYLDRDLVG
jgi:hypothetical protein